MREHIWNYIAPEKTIDEDKAYWAWCLNCGSMRLGSDVYYPLGSKMMAEADRGCPKGILIFNQSNEWPASSIDPFEPYVEPGKNFEPEVKSDGK
jgi:hypothetical protein